MKSIRTTALCIICIIAFTKITEAQVTVTVQPTPICAYNVPRISINGYTPPAGLTVKNWIIDKFNDGVTILTGLPGHPYFDEPYPLGTYKTKVAVKLSDNSIQTIQILDIVVYYLPAKKGRQV